MVIDWSKYCTAVESVDVAARTCVVQPGIVLEALNGELAPTGLRYGPEPATHANCTIGGMIGNNSCGATAQRTGKVVDNIRRLEVLLPNGVRFWCGKTTDERYAEIERHGDLRSAVYRQLRALRDEYADEVRRRYPDIPRRVSGYNLDSLLPEHGFDVAGLLVGSESALVTILRAELELVPVIKERVLVVLGFPSIDKAADAVPAVLPHEPIALEGIDSRLIHDQQLKHINARALHELPEGNAFLMVQFGGDTLAEVEKAAHEMLAGLDESEHGPTVAFLDDPAHEEELWQVREAGLGATAHVPDKPDTFEATYNAEFLSHHYAKRQWRRPRSDLSMGWLPAIAQLVGRLRLGSVVNAVTHAPLLSRAAVALAGVENREIPKFAAEPLHRWFSRRGARGSGSRGTVLLWPDTFTNFLHPHVGQAAIDVLEDAGWR